MAYADAAILIDTIFRDAFSAPEVLSVDRWADRHRVVAWGGPKPGPWETDAAPHLREPMRDFTDPDVRKIVCMFSPQTGKTEVLINCLLYAIAEDPADAILYFDRDDTAREFATSRLIPNVRACARTALRLGDSPRDTNQESIRMEQMTAWMSGAGSSGQLASKPAKYVLKDEVDKWAAELRGRGRTEGSASELADARADAWGALAKIIETSTPTDQDTGIHASFMLSDQAERHYPCPHCGGWQTLILGDGSGAGVVFGGPGGEDLHGGVLQRMGSDALAECAAHVRQTAAYRCLHCGELIEAHQRDAMLRQGVWIRAGQRIEGAGEMESDSGGMEGGTGFQPVAGRDGLKARPTKIKTGARIVGRARKTEIRGYRAGWLDVRGKRWGDVAAEFVLRRGIIDRGFVNRVLAEPWKPPGSGSSVGRLLRIVREQAEADGAAVFVRGVGVGGAGVGGAGVPRGTGGEEGTGHRAPGTSGRAGPALVLGTCDVQQDRVVWQIAAYHEGQRWDLLPRTLLDYGETPWAMVEEGDEILGTGMEARAAAVLDLLAREVPGWGGVDVWGIDSGFRTGETYLLCALAAARMGLAPATAGRYIVPMKGQDRQAVPIEWTGTQTERVGAKTHAAMIRYRLGMRVLLFDAQHFRDHVYQAMHDAGRWRWPADTDEQYLAQLTSEQRVEVKRFGRVIGRRWERRGRADNHWWDCTVMESALLCATLGGGGLSAAAAPRRPAPGAGSSGGTGASRRPGATVLRGRRL